MRVVIVIIFLLLTVSLIEGQSKTKITMTVEKDSIAMKELAELIQDIQKLEKKWKLDVKIEFEKQQEGRQINQWRYFLNGSTTIDCDTNSTNLFKVN